MANRFAERTQLNLSDVNKEVLKMWDDADVFHKSMTEREGCLRLSSSKVLLQPTGIRVSTMSWHVLSRIRSVVSRP